MSKFILFFSFLFLSFFNLKSETMILDNLENPGKTTQNQNWSFFTDGVMGGLSEGTIYQDSILGTPCYRMTGNVTTENNGGFLMTRTFIKPNIKAKEYTGIYIKVYGNGEDYFLHVKTPFTPAVWQYYGYKFKTSNEWLKIKAPFSDFKRSNFYQPKTMINHKIKNVAVVAGFNDYKSDICFAEIGFY